MKETLEEQQDFVKDITKMSDDFDRWYTDVVRKAELADWSGVRGMMVVRPYGWAMWEAIQRAFDDMIKESGHENWAFPLLIPRVPDEGGRARRGLRARGRLGDESRRSHGGARGPARRAAHVGDHHRRDHQALHPEPPRPAEADEPVEQRRAVGDALAPVPAQPRVLVAGGPHVPCLCAGGHGRGQPHPQLLPLDRRGLAGGARAHRAEVAVGDVSGRGL